MKVLEWREHLETLQMSLSLILHKNLNLRGILMKNLCRGFKIECAAIGFIG